MPSLSPPNNYSTGPAENEPMFTARFKRLAIDDISKPDVPVRDLRLTQNISKHELTVYASEFVPLPNDKTSLKWKDSNGNNRETKMPPYCLTNMQKVTAQITHYIYVAKRSYLESLKKEDELVSMTVAMAMNLAQKKSVGGNMRSQCPSCADCCRALWWVWRWTFGRSRE